MPYMHPIGYWYFIKCPQLSRLELPKVDTIPVLGYNIVFLKCSSAAVHHQSGHWPWDCWGFLSRCPTEIGWVDVEPDNIWCVGYLKNWYCKACEKVGDSTSDLNLDSNPFLSAACCWACLGRQQKNWNSAPFLSQATSMDFVRWIVENPLLDVLVKNNQNEDVPWPSALLRW